MRKPRRGGGIMLTITLGHATYFGTPHHTPSTARTHLKHHPEAVLLVAEQWIDGRYQQVDIGVPQVRQ